MKDKRIQHILNGLKQGKVTRNEADALLRSDCGTDLYSAETNHKQLALALGLGLVFMFIAIGFSSIDTPTGLITYELQNNQTNNTFQIEEAIAGLRISGTLYGEGDLNVYFETTEGVFVAASITSNPGTPRTSKSSYSLGEPVEIENSPEDASYYLDNGNTSLSVAVPFAAEPGELLIVANESGNLSTYKVPIIIGDAPRTTTFNEVCIETCEINSSNGTVRVETTGNAYSNITIKAEVVSENSPPILGIPYAPVTVTDITVIELEGHFTDPEEDKLFYSTSSSEILDATINGTKLTLSPISPGTETLTIYASDLKELVSATLDITVILNETGNVTVILVPKNETNVTLVPKNETVPQVNRTVNASINTTLDCSNPDPNLRPVDCLNIEAGTFFEEDIFLETVDRGKVARITSIGNLLIKGRVVKNSLGAPEPREFTISYKDSNFNTIPTVWINNGDLHLKGTLYEENTHITPPPGSYSVINRRGVYLAYVDRERGDLYLRGNVIPYREDVTK